MAEPKPISLALQGGGAHGAYTWGVLDRLLEDETLVIRAISGTSAGAMNAVVLADGLRRGGPRDGKRVAREQLRAFWEGVSRAGWASPIKRTPFEMLTGDFTLENSPFTLAADLFGRMFSPYQIDPFGLADDTLRRLLDGLVAFERFAECEEIRVFVGATRVRSGRARVFENEDMSVDAVMASACLPSLFHAVTIGGEPYWDGGFSGNPPIFPLLHRLPEGACGGDVLVVQINPIEREEPPLRAAEIADRVREITFNAPLLVEFWQILEMQRRQAAGRGGDEPVVRLHRIDAERLEPYGATSKLLTEMAFLEKLFDLGREAADAWLATHGNDVGHRQTLDLEAELKDPRREAEDAAIRARRAARDGGSVPAGRR